MSASSPDETLRPDFDVIDAHLDRIDSGSSWVLTSVEETGETTRTHTATFGSPTRKQAHAWIGEQQAAGRSVYIHYNAVKGRPKSKPKKEAVIGLSWLYVDLDPAKPPERCADVAAHYAAERERIRSLCENLPNGIPKPTVCVFSGGGYQLAWRLSKPELADGSKERVAELERYSRRLEEVLGADNCHNLDRMLRLAGTVNFPNAKKRAAGRVPVMAELCWADGPIADLGQFEKAAPKSRASSSGERPEPSGVTKLDNLDALDVPDFCKVVIAQGCDPDDPGRFGGAPSMYGLSCGEGWKGDRSDAVWYVVCELVRSGVDDDTIRALLLDERWGISGHVLDQKDPERCADRQIDNAREKAGEAQPKREDAGGPILDPANPRPSARMYVERESPHLLFHNGDWLDYGRGAYVEVEPGIVSAGVYSFLERARRLWGTEQVAGPFKPMRGHVAEVLGAMESLTIRARDLYAPPCWIAEPGPPPREIISCANGLLHLPTGSLLAATPSFFTRNALEIAYDPIAPTPTAWLAFLAQLWPNDRESIDVLQEVFGYLLVPDTSQQKVFMLVGPARSGKGTIGRVLTRLVGEANVVGSDMRTLGGNFGLQPLIGKQLAIVADMRLGKRSDPATIAENLLRISGEDLVTADRKNKTAWTGTLAVRFVIMTNELPRFSDASGALANRFVPLVMTESFLGREDPGLTARLLAELPAILNWAIEGWRRLHARGHFVLPGSSRDAVQDLLDMASPVSAFVRDECVLDPEARIEKRELYAAWERWRTVRGEPIAEEAVFSRDLYAATAGRVRAGKLSRPERAPAYIGIRRNDEAEARAAIDRDVLG